MMLTALKPRASAGVASVDSPLKTRGLMTVSVSRETRRASPTSRWLAR